MINKYTDSLIGLVDSSPELNSIFIASEAKNLIDRGADVNAKINDHKNTSLLSKALFKNNLDLVKLLLDNKANPNVQDIHGMTPLHLTIIINSPEMARLLLEKGADIYLTDKRGMNALDFYEYDGVNTSTDPDENKKIEQLGEILKEAKYKLNSNSISLIDEINLSPFSEKEIIKSVDNILKQGADVNYQLGKYMAVINYAVENNYPNLTSFLIKKGANLEIEYKPLLQTIRTTQDKKMIKILIENTSKEIMTDEYRKQLVQLAKDEAEFDRDYSKKDIEGVIKVIKETKCLEHSMEIFNAKKSGIKKANEGKRIRGFKK